MSDQKNLIYPATVVRDEYGFWTHPAWPDDGDECALPFSWFGDHGLEFCVIEMENDGPEELNAEWLDDGGDYDCTPWQPSKPAGDGWFIFSIHDTEDGPICVWVRRIVESVWSLTGDNGSWDYASLSELIRDNYGSPEDGTCFGPGLGNGLKVGTTVHRAIVCKDDPAKFLQDAGEVQEWMSERAYDSDAGEWADNYPEVDAEAKAALAQALEPLKAWARRYCQPKFFTVKDITQHELTEEDVRAAK